MTTTMQVSERTLRRLKIVKGKTGKTYDHILTDWLDQHEGTPSSLAGKYPELTWSKADRMRFRGEE